MRDRPAKPNPLGGVDIKYVDRDRVYVRRSAGEVIDIADGYWVAAEVQQRWRDVPFVVDEKLPGGAGGVNLFVNLVPEPTRGDAAVS